MNDIFYLSFISYCFPLLCFFIVQLIFAIRIDYSIQQNTCGHTIHFKTTENGYDYELIKENELLI